MPGSLHHPAVPFDQLVELSTDGVLVVDGAGRIDFANGALAALTGYAPDELVGQPVEALVPEGHRLGHSGARAAYDERPTVRSMGTRPVVRCRHKDGSTFPVEVALHPVATDGAVVTVVTVRDAAGNRRPPALAEAERRWRDLLDGVLLVVVGLDNDHRVVFANPFFLSLTGYTEDEVVGADWLSTFVSPERGVEVHGVFERVIGASGSEHHVNAIVTRHAGQRLIAWFNTARHDEAGDVVGTLSIGEDITDRMRAEARLQAISEVADGVLNDQPLDELLQLLAERASQLVDADAACIVLPHGEALTVAAAVGAGAERLRHSLLFLDPPTLDAVLDAPRGERIDDAGKDRRVCPPIVELADVGPVLLVPLAAGERSLGTLLVGRHRGGRGFSPGDLAIVESVASHASIAIEHRGAQEEMQRLLVVEDRERIARDLHDHVIQRLFATGLGLAAARKQAREPLVADRIGDAVEQLDATIADLRSSIFDLRRGQRSSGLRAQLLAVVDDATGPLGLRPRVHFAGMIDASVSDDVDHDVVGVLREALSNVARHAHAHHVLVDVEVGEDLLVRVRDDGVGIPASPTRRSGLGNLEARAAALGGTLQVRPAEGGGTHLEWRVPLGHRPVPR